MLTNTPPAIHNLRILSPREAAEQGFTSITTDIHADMEERILAGVCQHRNPDRACLIKTGHKIYQLGILREDVSHLED